MPHTGLNSAVNDDRSARFGGPSVGDGDGQTPAAGRDYGDILWAPTPRSAEHAEITRYARWLASRGGPVEPGTGPGELVSYR